MDGARARDKPCTWVPDTVYLRARVKCVGVENRAAGNGPRTLGGRVDKSIGGGMHGQG